MSAMGPAPDLETLRKLPKDDMQRLVDDIKQHTPIQDVIEASGFPLVPEGREYRGKDRDSLVVTPEKGLYQWHSQGEGGDVLTWIMNRERCDFVTAVARLANMPILPRSESRPAPRPQAVKEVPPLDQDLHLRFHRALDPDSRAWWYEQGIDDEAIDHFLLGVVDHEHYGRCYTIPILEHGQLVNLRMRLENPLKGNKDKYRPWARGYGTQLYNIDILTPDLSWVVVTAGEKKVIVMWRYGFPAVSPTGGCDNWKSEWTECLQHCEKVYIVFDPTETAAAWKLAEHLGERAFVASVPDKPDDYLLTEGGEAFQQRLREAEPVVDRDYWRKRMGGRSLYQKLLG